MKKFLSIALSVLLLAGIFAGCGEKTDNESKPNDSSESYESEDTVKGFSGTVSRKWDDVKDDFLSLENAAEAEVGAITTISRADIENTVREMKEDLKELENGVDRDNEEKAKEVYKDAHKLEVMAKKGDTDASKEFKNLAKNTKALVKQYYGVADDDYETVRGAVKESIDKVGDFTDDIWNAFLDLFK